MLTFKIVSVLITICIPFISVLTDRILRLRKIGIKPVDIAFPLLVSELYNVSKTMLYHNLLPFFAFVMSVVAIGIAMILIRRQQVFSYKRFVKVFWRMGFLIVFPLHIGLLIYVCIFV